MTEEQFASTSPQADEPGVSGPKEVGGTESDTTSDVLASEIQALSQGMPLSERRQQVCRVANIVFQRKPDWVVFFRDVLGVDGVVRRMFPNESDLLAFEQSVEFSEIQQMVAQLRERSKHQSESDEPTRVITVRLPRCLHESLRAEAHQRHTSMNQLCISKLLQIIDNHLVPSD